MSACENMGRTGAPSAGGVIAEMLFGTVIVIVWFLGALLRDTCGVLGRLCIAAPAWAASFAASFLLYSVCHYFLPVFAAIDAGIGLAMMASAGASVRVAAAIASNNAPVFKEAFLELTHQPATLLEQELNRPQRERVIIDARTGRIDNASE